MSITVPSAPADGIVIQSPIRSMSFDDSCTPATRPSSVSLKISISTADIAPMPDSSRPICLPVASPITTSAAVMNITSLTSCIAPFSDRCGWPR